MKAFLKKEINNSAWEASMVSKPQKVFVKSYLMIHYILVIKLAFAFMHAYMHASTHGV